MKSLSFSLLGALLVLGSGCGGEKHSGASTAHGHAHAPKHGGVLAELGEEEFHLEFVHSDTPGALLAYVLDAHVEGYVRIAAPSFAATALVDGLTHPLVFQAVPNHATGETAGDTALFEARAGWLASQPGLKISVPEIEIKGRRYAGVTADLPRRKP